MPHDSADRAPREAAGYWADGVWTRYGARCVPDGIASVRLDLFLPCAVIIFAGRPAAFGTLPISSPMRAPAARITSS